MSLEQDFALAVIDWLAWRRAPDWWFAPGALLIVCAGATLLRKPGRAAIPD